MGLAHLGVALGDRPDADADTDGDTDGDTDITAAGAEVSTVVVTAREDLEVAREVQRVLE